MPGGRSGFHRNPVISVAEPLVDELSDMLTSGVGDESGESFIHVVLMMAVEQG
jgi:hypothetical protein